MAYSEALADRIRAIVHLEKDAAERRMFGGLCFLVGGRMCCGVLGDRLIAKVPKEDWEAAARKPHTAPFDFTGRPMAGILYVDPPAIRTRAQLAAWVAVGIAWARSQGPKGAVQGARGKARARPKARKGPSPRPGGC